MSERRVTVSQVAAAVSAGERTVTGWRSGDRGPSPEEALKLAELFDQPELLDWWDWPAGSGPVTSQAPEGAPRDGSNSDPTRRQPGLASTPPPRRVRRWVIAAIAAAVVVLGLVLVAVHELTPGSRQPAEEAAATSRQQSSSDDDRLNAGPTVTITSLSCDGPVPIPPASTIEETQGSLGATTFTDPVQTCGAGPKVDAGLTVLVACRLLAPQLKSVNPDGYWYLIASGPNRGRFAAANTFLNGDAPGAGNLTNTDTAVPRCVFR